VASGLAASPEVQDTRAVGSRLSIRRGIVAQVVDDVKTKGSAKTFGLAEDLLTRLKDWKQASQFTDAGDWVFASPVKIGRLPYSYTGTRRILGHASEAAGLGHLTTHAFRHTYRSWLDAVKTPIAVQQKMMRHASIITTMDVYGDVVTDEARTASSKVAELAFRGNGAQAERNPG
jgi:integrase